MRVYLSRKFLLTGTAIFAAMTFPACSWADRVKHPRALFTGLDKITGRTIAFEAAAGETVQFGTLQITERACFTRPATEAPQTATFIEVDEVGAGNGDKRIFSGWMFAASPGLHGIEHPIYDVWLTDCAGEGTLAAGLEAPKNLPLPETPQEDRRAAPQLPRHERPSETPPLGAGDAEGALPPDEEPGAELPALGEPVEVGPPPGFIPVPQGARGAQAQRAVPAVPSTQSGSAPEASDDDGL